MASHDGYVLGSGESELARLDVQARYYRMATLDAMRWAGIGPGMDVLDIGCGERWGLVRRGRVGRRVGVGARCGPGRGERGDRCCVGGAGRSDERSLRAGGPGPVVYGAAAYTMLTGIVRTVLPAIVAHGIASESEIDLDTLETRLRSAAREAGSGVTGATLVSAWSRDQLQP